MKRFVRSDKRFYNMTKRQSTFLCINDKLQKSYKSLTKKLQKLQGCNKYLPLGARPVSAGQVRVYALSGTPCQYIRLKELRLAAWAAAFGSAGSCVSKGATSKRSVAAVGATILDY